MLADDAKALVDSLGNHGFPPEFGPLQGGMIAQEYALAYGADLRSATFGCTYAAPGPFCSRMFDMWAGMAPVLGIPYVMRDVTLWAFTVPFFEQRGEELAEFEDRDGLHGPAAARLPRPARRDPAATTPRRGWARSPSLPSCSP